MSQPLLYLVTYSIITIMLNEYTARYEPTQMFDSIFDGWEKEWKKMKKCAEEGLGILTPEELSIMRLYCIGYIGLFNERSRHLSDLVHHPANEALQRIPIIKLIVELNRRAYEFEANVSKTVVATADHAAELLELKKANWIKTTANVITDTWTDPKLSDDLKRKNISSQLNRVRRGHH